jgi:CheY-like chemotaxis protein/anti-anti-sigma regulatory factor
MHRLVLSDTGAILNPERRQSAQEWIRQRAAEGQTEIRIDLAGVRSANSAVLVALSLVARQARELGLPVVLLHANGLVRLALTQLGLVDLGLTLGADDEPTRQVARGWGSARPVVLVVDDDAINRKVASLILARMGCEAREAEHGLAAVEACRAHLVDLILMDVSMPIMDGSDATRMIRASEVLHGRHMPIIGLSACTLKEDHALGRAAGMDAYLDKPIEIPRLTRVLEHWLPGRITPMGYVADATG